MADQLHVPGNPVPGLEIRDARAEDCLYLGPRLRDADREEVLASVGMCGIAALLMSFSASDRPMTASLDGKVVAMFGVAPTLDKNVGAVWFLGSDKLSALRRPFLRESRRWIEEFQKDYLVLTNAVDIRNKASIRWLKWLGCKFPVRIEDFGVAKIPFLQFVRYTCVQ